MSISSMKNVHPLACKFLIISLISKLWPLLFGAACRLHGECTVTAVTRSGILSYCSQVPLMDHVHSNSSSVQDIHCHILSVEWIQSYGTHSYCKELGHSVWNTWILSDGNLSNNSISLQKYFCCCVGPQCLRKRYCSWSASWKIISSSLNNNVSLFAHVFH